MGRDINRLHPLAKMTAKRLVELAAAEGLRVKITDCVRTKSEQDSINASRTNAKYPYSYHNWGLAFDICQNDKNEPYPREAAWWNRVGAIGKSLGLEWGGDWWSPQDRPHFQLNTYTGGGNHIGTLVIKYGDPERFFKSNEFKIVTPKLDITMSSSFKKVAWLQTRLCCHGYKCAIDGKYGTNTINSVKRWYNDRYGKNCTGKRVTARCINELAKD